jgi:signal transduction histidine kinase
VTRRRAFPGLTLHVWVGGGVAFAIALVTVGFGSYLAIINKLDKTAAIALLAALVYAAGAGIAASFVAGRFGNALRGLRDDAVRRLQDPAAPLRSVPLDEVATRASTELAELASILDALHLRVRVADEVAERHRRTAENSSAGMFELLSGLVEAEEGTRGQLSAELHDTVAQTLMLARATLAGAPPSGELARAGDLIAEAEEQVRAVMARTRPPALRDGDLAAAVTQLRADMAMRYGLEVRVRWPSEPYPVPLVTAVTVYRFFQEALLNVVKHADVDEAWATLDIDERGVTASVSDSGPGFDPTEVRSERGRHVGLGLLRERARLAGGSLDVASWPAIGTTLTLRLPRGAAVPTQLDAASGDFELTDSEDVSSIASFLPRVIFAD